jgi:hypothetical protein
MRFISKSIVSSSDESESELTENFPGNEIDHTEEFLLTHGIPLDNVLRNDFCKIGAINIYFRQIVYTNHEQLFDENHDQLARYQKG